MRFGVVGPTRRWKAGGATALFYRGDWRGVAAFSYVEANARGAVEAAEFTCRIFRFV